MKRLLTLCLLAVTMCVVAQTKVIALLEPRGAEGDSIAPMEKAMIRGELRKAITQQEGYEAVSRSDVDQLMREQDFQRSGLVSENSIKKLGEMTCADYICVSTITKSSTEFYIEAYLIHIESGKISNPASQYGDLVDGKLGNMLPVCQALAQELLGTANPVVNSYSHNTQSAEEMYQIGVNYYNGENNYAQDYSQVEPQQKKVKVAVYVIGKNAGFNEIVGSNFVYAIARSGRYLAIERTNSFLSQLSKEQTYQHTGAVNYNTISRLGKQFGVQYVCVAEVADVFSEKYISARLINVESAQVERTASSSGAIQSLESLVAAANSVCADLLKNLN